MKKSKNEKVWTSATLATLATYLSLKMIYRSEEISVLRQELKNISEFEDISGLRPNHVFVDNSGLEDISELRYELCEDNSGLEDISELRYECLSSEDIWGKRYEVVAIFCQKTEVFSCNFQFTCREKLVHLGRSFHFSQKVVGVTLNDIMNNLFQVFVLTSFFPMTLQDTVFCYFYSTASKSISWAATVITIYW